jgi:alpha-tubulin suppressor-like RCC1 family protein
VTSIALGDSHSCALLMDGKVMCWGFNGYGLLGGIGTGYDLSWALITTSFTPLEVSGITSATKNNSLGYSDTCALLVDGKVMCWGAKAGTTPVEAFGITTATSIALGGYHSCALLTDSNVKCWGSNFVGQLGDGTTADSSNPVDVSGMTIATSIALGDMHSCALLAVGKVMCWARTIISASWGMGPPPQAPPPLRSRA